MKKYVPINKKKIQQTRSVGSDEAHSLAFANLGLHVVEQRLVLALAVAVGELAQLQHILPAARGRREAEAELLVLRRPLDPILAGL